MSQLSESESDDREIWQDHIDIQSFEHELINRKTTWWLSAQALLFTAYGVTLGEAGDESTKFREVVACAGLIVAVLTLIGVAAVVRSKYLSWRLYERFFSRNKHSLPNPHDGRHLQWGVRTSNTIFTLLPDIGLPVVFIWAWSRVLP
jgi:hypothetical protein